MRKISRCGFFIFTLFIFPVLVLAAEEPSRDLEKIVITKAKSYLLQGYSLSKEDLQSLPTEGSIEAATFLPIDLQSRSPKAGIQADFSLRGSTFQGVLVLLDGQRINDPQTAHHNSDIPLTKADIASIELLPGASSSLFGPDAIGGAINFQVEKPKQKNACLNLAPEIITRFLPYLALPKGLIIWGQEFPWKGSSLAVFAMTPITKS